MFRVRRIWEYKIASITIAIAFKSTNFLSKVDYTREKIYIYNSSNIRIVDFYIKGTSSNDDSISFTSLLFNNYSFLLRDRRFEIVY